MSDAVTSKDQKSALLNELFFHLLQMLEAHLNTSDVEQMPNILLVEYTAVCSMPLLGPRC